VSLFTSRFSSGLIRLENIKGFKRKLCRHLREALYSCGEPFWKISQV